MVTLKWFRNNEVVAVSNAIIAAGESEIWSILSISNVMPKKWENLKLSTNIFWFEKEDIKNIEWNRWSTQIEKNKLLENEYIYNSAGTRVIIQKIILNDGRELQNFLTVSVRDENLENSYAIQASINNLVSSVFSNIGIKVNNIWYIPKILLLLNRYTDKSSEKTYENLDNRPKVFEHQYTKEWIFYPKTSVFVDECISLDTTATIAITKQDVCMEAKLNWTLDQFKCDMDWDWIPDICDDDIDGDGMPNLIWLIDFENEDCSINLENINKDILMLHNNVCSLDNCPTFENSNQMDINNNWRWDQCDNILNWFNNNNMLDNKENDIVDSDWDWIPDHLDACPLIPENYNGIEDFDGCPEIWSNVECSVWNINYNILGTDLNIWWTDWNDIWPIIETECLSCPCAFSDFANDLHIDDKVKAILRNIDMDILYSQSIPETIKQFLN